MIPNTLPNQTRMAGRRLWLLAAVLLAACGPLRATPTAVEPTPKFPSTDPPVARDAVVAYVRAQHPEIAASLGQATWEALPEPRVHALAVYGYLCDAWRIDMTVLPGGLVEVNGALLQEDTFDVELKARSPPPYILWRGTYAPDSGVIEAAYLHRAQKAEAIAAETARDLAFELIEEAHPEVGPPGEAWRETEAAADAWSARHGYETGGWRVAVRWSEAAEAYEVDARYERSGEEYVLIEWRVRVSADGARVEEESFTSFYG
jgi:hypothetical protein